MVLHRAYLTPNRLHTMYPGASDSCLRCQAPQAKLFHLLWNCPRIIHYWSEIHRILHGIAPMAGGDSPEHCLLGVGTRNKKSGPSCKLINLALIQAKRNITMRWKATKAPNRTDWHREMVRWGRAEGAALQSEEKRGVRKKIDLIRLECITGGIYCYCPINAMR